MPITLDGSNGITTPTYGGADTSEYLVPVTQFKNRIINGAMQIDQRNAGASITPTDGQYTLDRWQSRLSQTSKYSIQRSSVAPSGFTNSLLVTSLSAYTVGASEFFQVRQAIEGLNFGDLGWGTANAKTITISFWVRSSLTGTFSGALLNDGGDRCFVFSYTINSTNTWEQKSVTISGDTTGTWLTNNSIGVYVAWSLGSGSSVSGTAGSWGSTLFRGATGAVSVVGTNGATFYITGVQFEVGSTATSFDYRPYGTELALCQRYYWETSKGLGGSVASSTTAVLVGRNPVTMRATPTLSGNAIEIYQLTVAGSKTQSSFNANTTISDPNGFALECANFTGLTQYYPVGMNSGKITFSSEL